MLYDVARDFVKRKFEGREGTIGVLLTGSASLGYVDDLSDIDLMIVAEQPIFRVLKECCGSESFCGIEIWWEWTTLEEMECALKDWKDDIDLWVYSKARILYDPRHTVENLLKKYRRYPKKVWLEKLFLYWFFATAFAPYDSGRAIQRGDFLTAQLYLSQAMEYYTALIFILNHSFVPYRKWRLRELDKLAFKPENYEENLRKVLTVEKWTKNELEAKQSIVNELATILGEKLVKAGVPKDSVENPWKFKVSYVPRV